MSAGTKLELDINELSEFPSLSGVPHPQYQNPNQAVWANANQRASQHTPVQRPQQSQGGAIGSMQSQPHNHLVQESLQQQPHDESFFPSQLSSAVDDYRHGGQGGIGQPTGSIQPQTTNIDDFPPLGRNGHGEIGQDRRVNIMQSAVTGLFPNNSAFSGGRQSARTIVVITIFNSDYFAQVHQQYEHQVKPYVKVTMSQESNQRLY